MVLVDDIHTWWPKENAPDGSGDGHAGLRALTVLEIQFGLVHDRSVLTMHRSGIDVSTAHVHQDADRGLDDLGVANDARRAERLCDRLDPRDEICHRLCVLRDAGDLCRGLSSAHILKCQGASHSITWLAHPYLSSYYRDKRIGPAL